MQRGVSDGHAVVGARASAELVEYDQRRRRAVSEDIRCLAQLLEERASASLDAIRGSHSGIDSVEDVKFCR